MILFNIDNSGSIWAEGGGDLIATNIFELLQMHDIAKALPRAENAFGALPSVDNLSSTAVRAGAPSSTKSLSNIKFPSIVDSLAPQNNAPPPTKIPSLTTEASGVGSTGTLAVKVSVYRWVVLDLHLWHLRPQHVLVLLRAIYLAILIL